MVRPVSLLPSATEIVYALGLGDDLAGVTFECDEPPAARAEKTIVVGGLDTSGMAPGDIDRYVRAAGRGRGAPVWAIDADGIVVRPGPRLVNGVEALASVIHPGAVPAAPPGSVSRVR